MGLKQILLGTQLGFQYYGESLFPNPNAVSSKLFFGQKSIGYGGGHQPYITIPLPENSSNQQPIEYIASDLNLEFQDGIWLNVEDSTFTKGNEFSYLHSIFKSTPNKIRYNPQSWGPDFLNRGNLFGFVRAGDDIKRLSKYFFSNNKPGGNVNGLIFTAKQNLLSMIAARPEAANYSPAYGMGVMNEGVYLPTSTIIQAGANVIQEHLFKQGIDPFGKTPYLKIRSYQDHKKLKPEIKDNRLYKIFANSLDPNKQERNYFYTYGGGPGAVLGIGYTRIHYSTDSIDNLPIRTLKIGNGNDGDNYLTFEADPQRYYTTTGLQDPDPTKESFNNILLINEEKTKKNTFMSLTPSYLNYNIEKRVNFKSGGTRGNRINYQKGKILEGEKLSTPLDIINASNIYKSLTPSTEEKYKDLIDFSIAIIDNKSLTKYNNDETKKGELESFYLHFRAFLDDFGDSYSSEWKNIEYSGRGEKFHKYGGFKRSMNLSFTLYASSKDELMPMYRKLNFLASSFAPSYSTNGYMMGNLVKLTVGDYLHEQMGFFSSLDISIPDSSPWEINVGLDGKPTSDLRQVPHMLSVKLKFTPIHSFRPEMQTLDIPDLTPFITYGSQRFISLYSSAYGWTDSYDIDYLKRTDEYDPILEEYEQGDLTSAEYKKANNLYRNSPTHQDILGSEPMPEHTFEGIPLPDIEQQYTDYMYEQ
jgi:hypothetical protein